MVPRDTSFFFKDQRKDHFKHRYMLQNYWSGQELQRGPWLLHGTNIRTRSVSEGEDCFYRKFHELKMGELYCGKKKVALLDFKALTVQNFQIQLNSSSVISKKNNTLKIFVLYKRGGVKFTSSCNFCSIDFWILLNVL